VATGTAIACGGYAVAILIYIRNKMHYHPLIRSAVLTSLFGYGLAGFSVMVDVGRPWNAYNFFVPSQWRPTRPCSRWRCASWPTPPCWRSSSSGGADPAAGDQLGRARAFLEKYHGRFGLDTPVVLEKLEKLRQRAVWLQPKLDKVLIFVIVLGITLPTMHQSSLGSLLLIASTKLHPLWHTGFLPLLFLINCMFIGYSIAILESVISSFGFKRPFEIEQLSGLASITPYLTTIWLCVVVGDLVWRGQVANALRFDFYSAFFLLEFALVASGSLLLFSKKRRQSPRWLFITAVLIVLGGALYRFNVYLIGFNPGQGWRYFPSLAELMITVGIVAFEILGYQVLVKLFPVLPRLHGHEVVEKA